MEGPLHAAVLQLMRRAGAGGLRWLGGDAVLGLFRQVVAALARPDRMGPAARPLVTGLPPHTLHPANPGIDFRAAYRWGLDGPFREWAGCGVGDGVVHAVNAHVRPWGAWAGRVGRWMIGREPYFVPF